MDLIEKSFMLSESAFSNDNLINEEATWQDVGGSCSDKPKHFSELHQEKYVPHARHRVSHLQTSALQPSLFFLWHCDPTRVMASSFLRFLDHTQRHTTVGRTPLDE